MAITLHIDQRAGAVYLRLDDATIVESEEVRDDRMAHPLTLRGLCLRKCG